MVLSYPGLDNINARLLKCGPQSISHSITKLFNLPIPSGKFPGIWKCSKVSALLNQVTEPIQQITAQSLHCALSARLQLLKYPNSTLNLLSNNQFGFRSKRSTATALSSFYDEFLLNMEKGTFAVRFFWISRRRSTR